MALNLDKPDRWKADVIASVDMWNQWFMEFAPRAFRESRAQTVIDVEAAMSASSYFLGLTPELLRNSPGILPTLRQSASPTLAVDRLIGLAQVPKNLVKSMERGRIPPRMPSDELMGSLASVLDVIQRMIDPDIFPWLAAKRKPGEDEFHRAATIVADRLCGSITDPIVRNAQEARQLSALSSWLITKGYKPLSQKLRVDFAKMPSGTFSTRMNVSVAHGSTGRTVNIPVDLVVQPHSPRPSGLPILIEAKSAGDFTNTNKRRKEEAQKVSQLRGTFGKQIDFILFLCGYFDAGYLGYEASEGIDWVWEHRVEDLAGLGL